jgi:3' exoribonuclease, RNase T-like
MDRDALAIDGQDPKRAMRDASRWVLAAAGEDRPVLVAYPVAFDWAFLFWYFIRWSGDSPFGYSSCLDIRTLYQARARTVHDLSGKDSMPAWLLPNSPHTHHALDDAREQAELFANVFEYVLGIRGPEAPVEQSLLSSGH